MLNHVNTGLDHKEYGDCLYRNADIGESAHNVEY
jgi:hypothetical protein